MNENIQNIVLICLGVLLVVVVILIISSAVKKSSKKTNTKYSCVEDKCVVTKGGKYSSKNCNNECGGKNPDDNSDDNSNDNTDDNSNDNTDDNSNDNSDDNNFIPGDNSTYSINFPEDKEPDYGKDSCEKDPKTGEVDKGSERYHCSLKTGECVKNKKNRCLPGGYVNDFCDYNCDKLYPYPENLGNFYTCSKDNQCIQYNLGGAYTKNNCENACSNTYKLVVDAYNLKTFKQHFVWDNPSGIKEGPDPTGGGVSYAYGLINYHISAEGEPTADKTWDYTARILEEPEVKFDVKYDSKDPTKIVDHSAIYTEATKGTIPKYIPMQYIRYKKGLKKPTVPRDGLSQNTSPKSADGLDHAQIWDDYIKELKEFEDKKSYWGEIGENPTSKELLSETKDGKIKISLAYNRLLDPSTIGGPRFSSKKFFRGGLFVFDVEQVPRGCTVWPALWLNGFVGGKEQYHVTGDEKVDRDSMNKILMTMGQDPIEKYTYDNLKGVYNHACKDKADRWMDVRDEADFRDNPEPIISTYAGKNIYPMAWPGGGEIDILEEQNFSVTNLLSVHGGPNCQVSFPKGLLSRNPALSTNANNDPEIGSALQYGDEGINTRSRAQILNWPDDSLRSVCGGTTCRNNTNPLFDGDSTKGIPAWNDSTNRMETTEPQNCNSAIKGASGDAQIIIPNGYGKPFNDNKGGVYGVHWIPKEKMYIYFWPRNIFSEDDLKKNGGPLSYEPTPDKWEVYQTGSGSSTPVRVLIGPYILNNSIHGDKVITEACDFNFQAIILNITLGGDWGGNVWRGNGCDYDNYVAATAENPMQHPFAGAKMGSNPPEWGTANSIEEPGYPYWRNYVRNCVADVPVYDNKMQKIRENPNDPTSRIIKSREYNKCRGGPDGDNILGKEADFIIRSIKVFQNPATDDTLW